MWKSLAAASGLYLALSFGAQAQLSGQSGPIQIEADQLEFQDREGKAIYDGNVDAIQGDARIRTDKLIVTFDQKPQDENSDSSGIGGSVGAVKSLTAIGSVYYMTPQEKAKGDKGVYNYQNDTITLTGNVSVTRGENVIVGDKLVINVGTGVSQFTSESTKKGERVRTVLITKSSEDE